MVIIDHAAIPAIETLASVLHQLPSAGAGIELQLLAVQSGQVDLRVIVARIVLLFGFPALQADEFRRSPGPAVAVVESAIVEQPALGIERNLKPEDEMASLQDTSFPDGFKAPVSREGLRLGRGGKICLRIRVYRIEEVL